MSDEQTTTPEETPPTGETPPSTDAPSGDETPSAEKPEEKPALSLEEALSEVTKTRGEAANYRTKLREAESKLANAKTLDEVNEIVSNLTTERETAERALLVENVALKHNLPEALQKRLVGSTREELEADAKALAALIPASVEEEETPPRLSGGLTPDDGHTEITDPGELARKHAPRR